MSVLHINAMQSFPKAYLHVSTIIITINNNNNNDMPVKFSVTALILQKMRSIVDYAVAKTTDIHMNTFFIYFFCLNQLLFPLVFFSQPQRASEE